MNTIQLRTIGTNISAMIQFVFTLALFFVPSVALYSALEDTWRESKAHYSAFLVTSLFLIGIWVAIWQFVGTWGWVQ